MNTHNGESMFSVVKILRFVRSLFSPGNRFLHFLFFYCFSAQVFASEHNGVFVSAKNAEQQEDTDRYVLKGEVFIIFDSWTIRGQRGYLEGPLDDPTYISVSGEPVSLMREKNKEADSLTAFCRDALLDLSLRVVNLEGGANLNLGSQTVSSDSISYSIDKNMILTRGRSKVRVSGIPAEKN